MHLAVCTPLSCVSLTSYRPCRVPTNTRLRPARQFRLYRGNRKTTVKLFTFELGVKE